MLGAQFGERHVHRHAVFCGHLFQIGLAFVVRLGLPGLDRAVGECLALVRNDQSEVDADDAPETAAGFAGAQR